MSYSLKQIGKVWHYRFQVAGKRIQRSTREISKEKADRIARRAHDRARIYARGDEPVPTLLELVTKWLVARKATASESHYKSVETFGRIHLFDLGDRLISSLSTDLVESTRDKLLADHAPASANQWLRILKLLSNWAVRREMIPSVPFRVRLLKVQKKPRKILPIAKAKEWLEAVDEFAGERDGIKIAIRLMLALGLREAEALSSKWEWFDWDRATYTPGKTKGSEADPIPVPGWLVEYLEETRRENGLVVTSPSGAPYAPGVARRVMARANVSAGTTGLTPHRLRGTFATLLSESGVPVQTIQQVLRHKDPVTTIGYLERDLSLAAKAAEEIAQEMGLTRRKTGEGASSRGRNY